MRSDLENDIRQALHGRVEHVTPDRLRHPDSPRPTKPSERRRRWALTGPLLAAACVALIALAITLVSPGDRGKTNSAGGQPTALNSLIGTSWSLTAVREDGHDTMTIPQRLSASVTFERGGVLSAQDGVNYYQAIYQLTGASEIQITGGTGTAAGYAGHDPSALAAINAIHALLYRADGQASSHPVTVHDDTNRLQLAANGYTLTLGDEVPVAPSSAPPVSSSASR